jgi:pilus assembly protein CpaE
MSRTAITVLSSDQSRLVQIATLLKREHDIDVSTIHGGATELSAIQQPPDVIIVNGKAVEEGGLDIVERLGQRHPDTVFIVVTENQSADFFRSAMRAGVREVLPCPVPDDQLRDALARARKRVVGQSAPGKVFAFIPAKGGSGSTFLAANLGFVLAENTARKVLLMDLNLQFGDAALFLSNQVPTTDLARVAQEIHRIDASFLGASLINVLPNYGVLAAPDDPAHSVDVKPQHVEKIVEVARKHYDFIILDLGRSLDAVSLRALDLADSIFPVLQMELPYIRDAKRLLGVLRSLGYPNSKINLLLNRYEKGTEIGLADLEKALGMRVLKTIPNSYQASSASINQGIPVARLSRKNPVSRALSELGATMAPSQHAEESGWFPKIFGRG